MPPQERIYLNTQVLSAPLTLSGSGQDDTGVDRNYTRLIRGKEYPVSGQSVKLRYAVNDQDTSNKETERRFAYLNDLSELLWRKGYKLSEMEYPTIDHKLIAETSVHPSFELGNASNMRVATQEEIFYDIRDAMESLERQRNFSPEEKEVEHLSNRRSFARLRSMLRDKMAQYRIGSKDSHGEYQPADTEKLVELLMESQYPGEEVAARGIQKRDSRIRVRGKEELIRYIYLLTEGLGIEHARIPSQSEDAPAVEHFINAISDTVVAYSPVPNDVTRTLRPAQGAAL